MNWATGLRLFFCLPFRYWRLSFQHRRLSAPRVGGPRARGDTRSLRDADSRTDATNTNANSCGDTNTNANTDSDEIARARTVMSSFARSPLSH